MNKYLIVGIGGFIGAIARFWLGAYVGDRMGTRFPYGTFIINITACLIIGFSLTLLGRRTDLNRIVACERNRKQHGAKENAKMIHSTMPSGNSAACFGGAVP